MRWTFICLLTWTLIWPKISRADDAWTEYKQRFGKDYKDGHEEAKHMDVYSARKAIIDNHNRMFEMGLVPYSMSVNQFTDQLVPEDYLLDNHQRPSSAGVQLGLTPNDVPVAKNWTEENRVTAVKDQGNCRGSWAFGVVGSLEGLKSQNSDLVPLSEQNLIDCSRNYGTVGCEPSRVDDAIRYVIDNGGIASAAAYPYRAADNSSCLYEPSMSEVSPTGYLEMSSGDEEILRQVIGLLGPVVATVIATDNFTSYSNGIFTDDNCAITVGSQYHTVLITGYGSNGPDENYWILKNSYGTEWGEYGYMRLARNKNNTCGIASSAFIPVK